jgi:signal transduction histidine kinase
MTTGMSRRAWLVYAAAWLPLCNLYVIAFLIGGETLAMALEGAVASVLPQALLGALVLTASLRSSPPTHVTWRPLVAHVLAAPLFALACALASSGLFATHQWIVDGVPGPLVSNLPVFAWQVFMALLVYAVIAGAGFGLRQLARVRKEEARAARAQSLQAEAELRALRAQLNPHFLFNTLHSLLALVRHDARAAEEALERFGQLLHHVLRVQRTPSDLVPLQEEIEFVEHYLALEQLRLGDRLRAELAIDDDARRCLVPMFALQPLVENAVRHGLAPRAQGGKLRVGAMRHGEHLVLSVVDDGAGAESAGTTDGHGLGLRLVRERLEHAWRGRATMSITTAPGEGFSITLTLPACPEAEAE